MSAIMSKELHAFKIICKHFIFEIGLIGLQLEVGIGGNKIEAIGAIETFRQWRILQCSFS